MQQSQLIRGALEGCVLGLIDRGEVYGYELIQALRAAGFDNLVGGTLYPLLAKLEKNGDVTSQTHASPSGPDRKYYTITPQGRQTLAEFEHQWQTLNQQVAQILGGDRDGES